MNIAIDKLVQLAQPVYGYRQVEVFKEAIRHILGNDALEAYEHFEAIQAELKVPIYNNFGLSHDQLRGVKIAEKEDRQRRYSNAQAVYQQRLAQLRSKYTVLLNNISELKQLLESFNKGVQALQDNFNNKIDALNHNYAAFQGDVVECDFEIHEQQLYADGYPACAQVSLSEVAKLLQHIGFSPEQFNHIDEDYDEYGHESFIEIKGEYFNLMLNQVWASDDRNITCTIQAPFTPTQEIGLIGGNQQFVIRQNYAEQLCAWLSKNRYVLDLQADSDLIIAKAVELADDDSDPDFSEIFE